MVILIFWYYDIVKQNIMIIIIIILCIFALKTLHIHEPVQICVSTLQNSSLPEWIIAIVHDHCCSWLLLTTWYPNMIDWQNCWSPHLSRLKQIPECWSIIILSTTVYSLICFSRTIFRMLKCKSHSRWCSNINKSFHCVLLLPLFILTTLPNKDS